jgi:tRNA (Thr-GGU) A37 N-methylase
VWLIFVFHENTDNKGQKPQRGSKNTSNGAVQSKATLKAKIKPPQLGGKRVGILSTRTPHRPNPIGLSTARIEHIDMKKGELLLSGIDLIDGTPILDIKPYVKMDCLSEYPGGYLVPEWVSNNKQYRPAPVRFSEEAESALVEACSNKKRGQMLDFFGPGRWIENASENERGKEETVIEACAALKDALVQLLALDIRAVHQGRGTATGDNVVYNMRFDKLSIDFVTLEDGVFVKSVRRYRKNMVAIPSVAN